MTQTERYT